MTNAPTTDKPDGAAVTGDHNDTSSIDTVNTDTTSDIDADTSDVTTTEPDGDISATDTTGTGTVDDTTSEERMRRVDFPCLMLLASKRSALLTLRKSRFS